MVTLLQGTNKILSCALSLRHYNLQYEVMYLIFSNKSDKTSVKFDGVLDINDLSNCWLKEFTSFFDITAHDAVVYH